MLQEIRLSEARRQFSALLRQIDADPETGFRIKVHNRVVAELRSPAPREGRVNTGAALLQLASEIAGSRPGKRPRGREVTSENYKAFLYGRTRPAHSRRRR